MSDRHESSTTMRYIDDLSTLNNLNFENKKLYSLEKMPGYKKSLKHRDAGLERTINIYSIK